jgi:hypothetical protein
VLLVGTLALAGCGNATKTVSSTGPNGQATTQTVPNVHFAKTKFVLHAGLAFGAIHRYIYKPLRAGALRSGTPGRVKVLAPRHRDLSRTARPPSGRSPPPP